MDEIVLPHYLSASSPETRDYSGSFFSTVMLLVGEVISIIYPNDPQSVSKSIVEYIVMVRRRDGNGIMYNVPYRCVLAPGFGGLADAINYTLRPSTAQTLTPNGKTSALLTNGNQVLVACVNGELNQAYIIGGARNPKAADDGRNSGHHFDFSFNGVEAAIDNDGQLSLSVPGPTNIDGNPSNRDSNNFGSKVDFAKDGTITISSNRSEDGDSIVISPKDKQITVKTDTHETDTTSKWKLSAGDNVEISTEGDVKIDASGDAKISASGNTYIGSSAAMENLVLGKTLVIALNQLISIFTANAATFGIGNLGFPVPISPPVAQALAAWQATFLTPLGPVAPIILADDKFTEK